MTKRKPAVREGSPENEVKVFDYDDYHVFLRDWIRWKKSSKDGYSFQLLANRAGLKSRSFIRLVSVGERDLLYATALKLSIAMGHDSRESEYFLALVGYNNATDPKERALYFEMLSKCRKPVLRQLITAQKYEFFGKWYIIPLWELVTIVPFGGDFRLLAERLDPSITVEEARHGVKVLLDLELIEPKGDRYAQRDANLHTRDELVSKAIREYQAATMELGLRALERTPVELRQINTLTLGLDAERWEKTKVAIKEFRQKLVDIASEVSEVDRVYQLNLQSFPLTKLRAPPG